MLKEFFSRKTLKLDEIRIQHTNDVSPSMVQSLYIAVGWQYRDIQDIKKAMEKSILVTSAWHKDLLIGIARATGDGIFNATIWDVAVKPNYQKKGVGKLIMQSMLTKLDDYGIPLITLYTEWAKKDFYCKLGFETQASKIVGMYRYKYCYKKREIR